jgi:hypothetical protein
MRYCLKASTLSRTLAVLLACSIAAPLPAQAPAAPAAPAAPTQINILILEGEGAINNVRQRVSREAMVQVEDENHKPVAAAAVTFFLPGDGASGVFSNGSRSITVLTDAQGKAAVRGIQLNKVQGKLQIRVQASFQGLTNNAVITQTSVAAAAGAAAGGAISGKLLAIILIGAAAGVAGGFAIANNSGGTTAAGVAPGTPAAVVVPGTPTVGPPK